MEMIRVKESKKETKTYRYESEVIKHSEKNPLITSFPEWACDQYRKEFMDIESLSKKMQNHIDIANNLKDKIQQMKKEIKKGADLRILKPTELLWIKIEAQRRIKRTSFEGVYKFFIRNFNRNDINRKQFRLLVDRFKAEKQG